MQVQVQVPKGAGRLLHRPIVCKFGSDRAIFGVVVAIGAKKFTDTQTDDDAARLYSLME